MKLSLNREYFRNHLFVTVLMAAMSAWFAYDGFVRYPSLDAAALYEKIEGAAPGEGWTQANLEAFKRQKIKTQHGFALLALLASAVVGLRLLKSARFSFEFDDDGFTVGGERRQYSDIKSIDDRDWERKGIMRLDLGGRTVVLDGWHHKGVRDFRAKCGRTA
ncbi:MAG: hypothetical protein J6U17_00045 [Kiritimatiellae bacterium]|nr:hypothetical protein [Kiritimatiellia bacterium]